MVVMVVMILMVVIVEEEVVVVKMEVVVASALPLLCIFSLLLGNILSFSAFLNLWLNI